MTDPLDICPACGHTASFHEVTVPPEAKTGEEWLVCDKCMLVAPIWAFDVSGDVEMKPCDLPGKPVFQEEGPMISLRILH